RVFTAVPGRHGDDDVPFRVEGQLGQRWYRLRGCIVEVDDQAIPVLLVGGQDEAARLHRVMQVEYHAHILFIARRAANAGHRCALDVGQIQIAAQFRSNEVDDDTMRIVEGEDAVLETGVQVKHEPGVVRGAIAAQVFHHGRVRSAAHAAEQQQYGGDSLVARLAHVDPMKVEIIP